MHGRLKNLKNGLLKYHQVKIDEVDEPPLMFKISIGDSISYVLENEAENVDVKSSEEKTEVANNTTEKNENAEEMDSKDKVESDKTDPAT